VVYLALLSHDSQVKELDRRDRVRNLVEAAVSQVHNDIEGI
jgi:hypothetical protein